MSTIVNFLKQTTELLPRIDGFSKLSNEDTILNWLHISDLHFSSRQSANDDSHQNMILDEMINDIILLIKKNGRPDFLFITGDIAYSGSFNNEYKKAQDWLQKLSNRTGIPSEMVYLVPGNHDVNRLRAHGTTSKILHKEIRNNIKLLDEFLASPDELNKIYCKFEEFSNFSQNYAFGYMTTNNPYFAVDANCRIENVSVIGLNSCFSSYDDQDSVSNLALGAIQIRETLQKISNNNLTFVLTHHPPEWLNDGNILIRELQKRPSILLHGHNHIQQGLLSSDFNNNKYIRIGAGSGFIKEKERISFCWGQLCKKGIYYYPRIWSEQLGTFRPDSVNNTNLSTQGYQFTEASNLPKMIQNFFSDINNVRHSSLIIQNEVINWSTSDIGCLLLKLNCEFEKVKDEKFRNNLISKLREFSNDESVDILALAKGSINVVLIGTDNSLKMIYDSFSTGKLSSLLSIDVVSVDYVNGATVNASSISNVTDTVVEFERKDLYLFCTPTIYPPVLKGISLSCDTPLNMNFIFDQGDSEVITQKQCNRLVNYFAAGVTLPDLDIYVNLSEFESNRMLPDNLAKTELGKDLLSQDCILKRLTASLLHPDSKSGRNYWETLYKEASKLLRIENIGKIKSYFKIWITAYEARVYEAQMPFNENDDKIRRHLVDTQNGYLSLTTKASMKVMSEQDYYAQEKVYRNNFSKDIKTINQLSNQIFQDIIIPEIQNEVNQGENFFLLRQIYHSLIIASAFKQKFKCDPRCREFIDSGDISKIKFNIGDIKPGGNFSEFKKQHKKRTFTSEIENKFIVDIPLQKDKMYKYFYNQYVNLFRSGLFNCSRSFFSTSSRNINTRLYASGNINFRNIPIAYLDITKI